MQTKIIKAGNYPAILLCFGWLMGFEPTTHGTTIRYSNQLSYSHHLVPAKIMNYPVKMKPVSKKARSFGAVGFNSP